MLIKSKVLVQNMNVDPSQWRSNRWIQSFISIKNVYNTYIFSVKNSVYPNCIHYKCSNIKELYVRFVSRGRMGILFKEPKHQVLLECEDKRSLVVFARQIRSILDGSNVLISRERMPLSMLALKTKETGFNPSNTHCQAINRFDPRILNMTDLQKLVLENVTVKTLPEQLGDLPLVYLSMNNLKVSVTASRYEKDTFFNWMGKEKISKTLRTLHMNNIGLNMLPFELMFVRRLRILSVANNNLEYLPHYIGELSLKHLDVSGNKLKYFPHSFKSKHFHAIDISHNKFSLPLETVKEQYGHIELYMLSRGWDIKNSKESNVKKLTHLSLIHLLENNVQFKRQDIPRTLWHLFEVLARCIRCKKYTPPQKVTVKYDFNLLASTSITHNYNSSSVLYQGVICQCDVINL